MNINQAAAIQMLSAADREQNLAVADALLERAAGEGAKLAVLPENFAFMGAHEADKIALAEPDGEGVIQNFLAEKAAKYKLWIVGGTIPIRADEKRVYASSLVFNEHGERKARFDKIHLFDVSVPDADEHYKESDSTIAGQAPVVVDTPVGKLGLSVCYDLRFPELYRQLSALGAQILAIPSAFTAATGAAHWEVLVRARAIENLCYVIAPNQGGRHANGRETYGDSMLVNPWGQVLDRIKSGPGIALGSIDLDHLERTRAHFPCLQHRTLM